MNGGTGLRNDGVVLVDRVTLQGGAGFMGGQNGLAFTGNAPVTTPLSALVGPALPVLPGGQATYTLRGRQGAFAWFVLSVEAGFVAIPGIEGMFGLLGRFLPLVIGPFAIDAAGNARLDVSLPNDPGLRGAALFAQALTAQPSLALSFSSLAAATIR